MADTPAWFLVTLTWQSTILLGAAAGASMLLRRRPALAHLLVTAGLVGTVACAIGSAVVHRAGAGLLHAAASPVTGVLPPPSAVPGPAATPPAIATESTGAADDPAHGADDASAPPIAGPSRATASRWMPAAAIGGWLALSLAILLRSAARARAELRLVRAAPIVTDPTANAIAASAAAQFGVAAPLLRAGPGPALWAWGRRPTILLPPEMIAAPPDAGLRSIITHELAHWSRRDHLTLLLSWLMVIALPWQPCVWWCRRRLAAMSEEACDAWVLAFGSAPRSYADVLMRLAAHRGARLALSAVGTRRRMTRRLASILADKPADPRLGPARVACVAAVTAAAVASASLAQPAREALRDDAETATPQAVGWIRAHATRLDPVDPDPSAMQQFGDLIGDARVVAMGMSVQGSRELFEYRRRLLEYLIENRGARALVLGTSFPDCLVLDDCVVSGRGDAEAALYAQAYWTYDTTAVLETVESIRAANAGRPGIAPVHLYGMDMQRAGPALDAAAEALRPYAPAELRELERRLAPLHEAYYTVIDQYDESPPDRRAQLTAAAARLVELFDEHRKAMIDDTSTHAWAVARRQAVIVEQFETWLRAHYAWLPPMSRRVFMDLWGRTETALPGLIAFLEKCDPEYARAVGEPLGALARDTYWTGRSLAGDPASRSLGDRIVARLDALRPQYEVLSSPADREAARTSAATLAEWLAACATLPVATVDEPAIVSNRLMADNVRWILDQVSPDGIVVIWAHNGAIGRHNPPGSNEPPVTLGDALAQEFGAQYRPIALTFGTGAIEAIHQPIEWDPLFEQRLGAHTLAGPASGQIEAVFLGTGLDAFLLDLRTPAASPGLRRWLGRPQAMWSIGPGYSRERQQRGDYVTTVVLPEQFDGLVFVRSSTPSRPNARTRARFGMNE